MDNNARQYQYNDHPISPCGVSENLRIVSLINYKLEEHILDRVTDPINLLVEATEYFLKLNSQSIAKRAQVRPAGSKAAQKNINDDRKLDTDDIMVMEGSPSNSTVDADRPDQAQGNSWE